MSARSIVTAASVGLAGLVLASGTVLAGSPNTLWRQPNPGGLAASVTAVAWSPDGNMVATGLNDRWLRIRSASDGREIGNVLQPRHSGGPSRLVFSNDGKFLAVGNGSPGAQFRVYQLSSLAFLGLITGTPDGRGIVRYGSDAQLDSAPGGAGNLSGWRLADMPIFVTTGAGYDTVTTKFQLSPNGALQTAMAKGSVTVRRTSDGAVVATLSGNSAAFSPDSATIAAWTASPNQIRLYRTSDFAAVRTIPAVAARDTIGVAWTAFGNVIGAGYMPFLKPDGGWDQKGIIRIWRSTDGRLVRSWDSGLDIGVTSNLGFAPGGGKFAAGFYNGTTIAAVNQ
jgi:WD40 repeat protein